MRVTTLAKTELSELGATIARAMPTIDETQQRLAVAIYRELALGEPVSIARLVTRVGLPPGEVSEILGRWPGVYHDSNGAVIGFLGLTLAEMPPHRFEVEGQRLWTWCAWDSLFIPIILGMTARVESVCATTGSPVSMVVTPEGVAEGAGAVISFLRPDREFDQDVILSFCHHVLFFDSQEAGIVWAADRPNAFFLSIEQGFELGRVVVEAKFGAALGPAGRGSV
jgi:alkylmercury lyase